MFQTCHHVVMTEAAEISKALCILSPIPLLTCPHSHVQGSHDQVCFDGEQNGADESFVVLRLDAYSREGGLRSGGCATVFLSIRAAVLILRIPRLQNYLSTGELRVRISGFSHRGRKLMKTSVACCVHRRRWRFYSSRLWCL